MTEISWMRLDGAGNRGVIGGLASVSSSVLLFLSRLRRLSEAALVVIEICRALFGVEWMNCMR